MDKYKKRIDELKIEYDKQYRIVLDKKHLYNQAQKEFDEANRQIIVLNNQNNYYDDLYNKVSFENGVLIIADMVAIAVSTYLSIKGLSLLLTIPVTVGAITSANIIQNYNHKEANKVIKSISKRENNAKIAELKHLLTAELIDKRFDAEASHTEEAIKLGEIRREVDSLTLIRKKLIEELCKEQLEEFIDEKENYDVEITPLTNGYVKRKTLKQK